MNNENNYPRVIMGLDVSLDCIGVSIVADFGEEKPEIIKITHISPKISNSIKGIEALIKRKTIFETDFLTTLKDYHITDVIIEEPLLSNGNNNTVLNLIRFNGMISESIYKVLGIVPHFITSYDARIYAFPELLSLKKYNKKGEELSLKEIKKNIKDNYLSLFGDYSYDINKKNIIMDKINNLYPNVDWILNTKGEFKKENFDACDSLVCILAYININHYGLCNPKLSYSIVSEIEDNNLEIEYGVNVWDKEFVKKIIIKK